MKTRTKSLLLLLVTLGVGLSIGAIATGAAMNYRLGAIDSLREPGGFAERLEAVIQPRDDAQRTAIREALDRSHERFDAIHKSCKSRYAEAADSMRADLHALLTPEQQIRLDAFLEQAWRERQEKKNKEHKRD